MVDHLGERARAILPRWVKVFVRRHLDLNRVERQRRYRSLESVLRDEFFDGDLGSPRVGIFKEYFHYHKDYVRACREMGVSYRVLDLSADDWFARVETSGCSGFLVWPSPVPSAWKEMFDNRIRILVEDVGAIVYPSLKELWLYESKLRVREWLSSHSFPHPRTWVFYDRHQALDFAELADLPIVLKTDRGGSASGVYIVRQRRALRQLVRQAFRSGIPLKGHGPRERASGVAILQEYLPSVKEWRMVRVGESFFGYRKEPGADGVHSASHRWTWLDPPRRLLDLLHDVTEAGAFSSMDVDVFETTDGRYLINELQTVFGATTPADQLRVDGRAGRYVRRAGSGEWEFEEGDFSRNAVCNLRVQVLLQMIAERTLRGGEMCGAR